MSTTNAGIAKADRGVDPEWKRAAIQIVNDLALTNKTFTTDAVWSELSRLGKTTPEHRAMGPVMLHAKREGWVEIEGCNSCGTNKVMVASAREVAHSMDIAVYRSLITI